MKQNSCVLISAYRAEYTHVLLKGFVIYSPETSALRTFEKEGQILPLGVRGEGLLKLLHVLSKVNQTAGRHSRKT